MSLGEDYSFDSGFLTEEYQMAQSLSGYTESGSVLSEMYQSRLTRLYGELKSLSSRFGEKERAIMLEVERLRREMDSQTLLVHYQIHKFHHHSMVDKKRYSDPAGMERIETVANSPSSVGVAGERDADLMRTLLPSPSTTAMASGLLYRSQSGRKGPVDSWASDCQSKLSYITMSTQTDPVASDEDLAAGDNYAEILPLRPQTSPNRTNSSCRRALFKQCSEAMNKLELIADGFIDEGDLDEDSMRKHLSNLEYEEVTLKRADKNKLGLTLCYGSGEDETDIFVSEVEQQSIADKNGRIKPGDQILQINGIDVHTRNQAIDLFSQSTKHITLLLARNSPIKDSMPGETSGFEEDLLLLNDHNFNVNLDQTINEEDEAVLTDGTRGSANSAHEKDSGISRSTDSEPELPAQPCTSAKFSNDSISSVGGGNGSGNEVSTPSEVSKAAKLRASPTSTDRSPNAPRPYGCGLYRSESEGSLARELAHLHTEMEQIQLECDRLIESHAKAEKRVRKQVEQANLLVANLDANNQFPPASKLLGRQVTSRPAMPQLTGVSPPPLVKPVQQRLADFPSRLGSTPGIPQFSPPPLSRCDSLRTTGPIRCKEESSSAYNTGGESSRSTPLNHAKADCNGVAEDGKRDSALFTLPPKLDRRYARLSSDQPKMPINASLPNSPYRVNDVKPISPPISSGKVPSPIVTQPLSNVRLRSKSAEKPLSSKKKTRKEPTGTSPQLQTSSVQTSQPNFPPHPYSLGDVIYTSPDNLHWAILQQQRLLRDAMLLQAKQLKRHGGLSKGPVSSNSLYEDPDVLFNVQPQTTEANEEFAWKVKRRSDGSRYITKRPVRNKMLKERAEKLVNERCGLSTDDEKASELKIGRYWTKEEKKKHLVRARERKVRQEEVIRRKNADGKLPDQIVELSNRKMMKKKNHQVLDRFTTLQEMLSHGSRSLETSRAMGLLSVTTV